MVNIWGSPGFGKTSTAVETAHKLSDLGFPVYFFHLQGIDKIDKFLSKILSIFRSNLVDVSLAAEDKLVSLFTEIPCQIILIFDNIDDLLTNETSSAKIVSLFLEFLNSNMNILVTSRELLENMRDQVKGFQDVRIRPLSPVSSLNFVRQLLPSFSEYVVTRVANTCFHVPLAIKLVTPLIKENSEEIANKVLEELDLQEHRKEHLEQHVERYFDLLYEHLTLTDKHTLISLTVFSSAVINKDAAIDVVSGEKGVTSNAIRSLRTLVKKSLIDVDPNGEYYSIHPLIFSFIVNKANENDLQHILHSAKVRLCNFYLVKFERLNDKFLSGLSVHNIAIEDVMLHLQTVISLAFRNEFLDSQQHLLRVLSKAEIFLFLIRIPFLNDDIHSLYQFAMEKYKIAHDYRSYLTLYSSYYFQNIASSLFVGNVRPDVPKDIRAKVNLLLDATTSKLTCYEGILNICHGNVKNGIQLIESCLGHLRSCSDHLILKCLCLQILIIYYKGLNRLDKSRDFRKMAVKICTQIGNCNLFLIANYEFPYSRAPKENASESLVLFNYLLTKWSKEFSAVETKLYMCNFVHNIQQRQEVKECSTFYLHQINCYADVVVACLGMKTGQEALLDERIEFLSNCHKELEIRSSLTEDKLHRGYFEQLLNMYTLQGTLTKKKDLSIEACRKALDLSRQRLGEQHKRTAKCYFNVGVAENASENYSSALNAFCKAMSIMAGFSCDDSDFEFLGDVYLEQGMAYKGISKLELAVSSYQNALQMKGKSKLSQESYTVAHILYLLGMVQRDLMDLTQALATLKWSLQIMLNLFFEKRLQFVDVAITYTGIAIVYHMLGKNVESKACLENALEMNSTRGEDTDADLDEIFIYSCYFNLDLDENFDIKLLTRKFPVLKANDPKFFLCVSEMIVRKQLERGQYEACIATLHEGLDIKLDVFLQLDLKDREDMMYLCLYVFNNLLKQGKSELARKIPDSAHELSESLAKSQQRSSKCRYYCWKGHIHVVNGEYVAAIEALENVFRQQLCGNADHKGLHLFSRCDLATAYTSEGRYKDALKSLYTALPILQSIAPEGSEHEARLYHLIAFIAREMKNRRLAITNFRLAYKMYSKVFGKNHRKAEEIYLTYVQALIRL